MKRVPIWAASVAVVLSGLLATSGGQPDRPEDSAPATTALAKPADVLFALRAAHDNLTLVECSVADLREKWSRGIDFVVRDFPLEPDLFVDLKLEPFSVTGPGTRFVLGRKDGPDRTLNFDPSTIALFRGTVARRPGSHVFLALSDHISTGSIDLGPGSQRYLISSKGALGRNLAPGKLSIFRPRAGADSPPGVPICGVDGHPALGFAEPYPESSEKSAPALRTGTPVPVRGLQMIELAVETDFEFFSLFGDATETAAYLVALYAQVSDVFIRDVGARFELVFARVWDDPNDLFNDVDPTPLYDFRDYWNANMGAVNRDVAQLISGRRDYPFGGQGFLSVLCGSSAYSVVGYAMGFFPDPSRPSPFHYDIAVTAHELGHNSGTGHTHDSPNFLDTCDDPGTTPQRGTIMSYCGQTWSGQNANRDLYFHTVIVQNMQAHIKTRSCIGDDCNQNGIEDPTDIAGGTSLDTNNNNVPDECEDCNNNGVLDDQDIAGPTSTDLNNNAVPDDCEPDCNGNSVPDNKDIADGTSLDQYGNGFPDECEADCNATGISDYSEIQADMTIDVDRNAVLDACQDCDGDLLTDFDERGGGHNLWIASGLAGSPVREFYAGTGVLTRTSAGTGTALVNQGQDLILAPNGNVWVTSAADNRVMEFDASANYLGDFVASGSGGLAFPTGLIVNPDAKLLVASRNTNSVLAYDGATGVSLGEFVAAGAGGLFAPFGLTYGPNGNLFVTSATDEVIEFDGSSGALVGVLVSAASNGSLSQPRGLAFKPDGNLLVASFGTDEVLEFNGTTGAPLGKWAHVGTANRLTQDSPWGIRVAPGGNVYVVRTGTDFSSRAGANDYHQLLQDGIRMVADNSTGNLHLSNSQIYEFDVRTGNFVRTHIGGNDHGLLFPTGFDFVPGWNIDCNLNLLPDDCDIASGFSADANTDGVPDECQTDCNETGIQDRLDIIPYGSSFDCNANLVPDECDTASLASADCNANSIPDECEPDCNANDVADECDITAATSNDCNANGIPDECEPQDDCNNNGIQDICDLAAGTSADCNGNAFPDECDVAGGGTLIDAGFESGLPPGWSVSGIFQITGNCGAILNCDGDVWAYAGKSGSCAYGNNQVGELVSPSVVLAAPVSELRYCSLVNTELNFDFADVLINGELVDRQSGSVGAWQNRVIDLTPFRGQSVTITFHFQSDAFVSGTRGWLVDNVRLFSGSSDCGGNGIPDECEPDTDGDAVVDSCDACPAEPALAAPDEPTETTCADGIDNDCDGLTDAADWHCSGDCPYTCADINGSGTINLFDFASFALCFGNPAAVSQACTCSDLNLDGTVNLFDFATFSLVFNAPSTNSPPNCP